MNTTNMTDMVNTTYTILLGNRINISTDDDYIINMLKDDIRKEIINNRNIILRSVS